MEAMSFKKAIIGVRPEKSLLLSLRGKILMELSVVICKQARLAYIIVFQRIGMCCRRLTEAFQSCDAAWQFMHSISICVEKQQIFSLSFCSLGNPKWQKVTDFSHLGIQNPTSCLDTHFMAFISVYNWSPSVGLWCKEKTIEWPNTVYCHLQKLHNS